MSLSANPPMSIILLFPKVDSKTPEISHLFVSFDLKIKNNLQISQNVYIVNMNTTVIWGIYYNLQFFQLLPKYKVLDWDSY